MSNDSELESLQCYPFHLPEIEPDDWEALKPRCFINGELLDVYGVFVVPFDMLQAPLSSYALESSTWSTSKDAEIIRDLLDMAGIPTDEQGGDDGECHGDSDLLAGQ